MNLEEMISIWNTKYCDEKVAPQTYSSQINDIYNYLSTTDNFEAVLAFLSRASVPKSKGRYDDLMIAIKRNLIRKCKDVVDDKSPEPVILARFAQFRDKIVVDEIRKVLVSVAPKCYRGIEAFCSKMDVDKKQLTTDLLSQSWNKDNVQSLIHIADHLYGLDVEKITDKIIEIGDEKAIKKYMEKCIDLKGVTKLQEALKQLEKGTEV